jgi:hypothetical protein
VRLEAAGLVRTIKVGRVRHCERCSTPFRSGAWAGRFCSDRCRKATPSTSGDEPGAEPIDQSLVTAVRRELETNDAVDTFAGRLALQLATRLSTPDESGISSLSKELRTVMAAALEGRTPPAGEEPEDEVETARRRRDDKARAAAG